MALNQDAAADWLERQLTVLIDKLEGLARFRSDQCNALLGDRESHNWQGTRRHTFQREFHAQQKELRGLKQVALSLRTSVANAREQDRREHE
ncbi:hypothetical protein [Streptomyces javensis]|uniref:WXG100 family type VII secretion target n=2 Tax=Streptomyces javensis TaxID=114698 RepID=A0ABN1X5P3_9ACTN|nr:hypothetical protein [Streptomyces javensis]MBI0313570.1 hypothetical protein [Streptomyces javensis]